MSYIHEFEFGEEKIVVSAGTDCLHAQVIEKFGVVDANQYLDFIKRNITKITCNPGLPDAIEYSVNDFVDDSGRFIE